MIFLFGCRDISTSDDSIPESPSPTSPTTVPEDGENSNPQSPRTSVTGILTEPERPWSEIRFSGSNGTVYILSPEDAEQVHQLLSTMEAEEILTPFHYESRQSDPMFTIRIQYNDETWAEESIYSSETGAYYFRYTDTVGDQEDRGYVGGFGEAIYAILSARVIPIDVDFAEEELLSVYETFDEFSDEETDHRIVITTNTALRDFRFIEIGINPETGPLFFAGSVLHSADELLPEKPFIVTWLGRDMPHRGISFVDKNDITRYFSINLSGYDGSLFLSELK